MANAHDHAGTPDPVYIYTHGYSVEGRGPGGYGIIIRDGDGPERSTMKGFRHTTKFRMAVTAVLHGLRDTADVGSNRATIIESNTRYVVDNIRLKRLEKWDRNDWKRTKKQLPVQNADLWRQALELLKGRDVQVIWAEMREDNWEDSRCDKMANIAARLPDAELEVDEGFEQGTSAGPAAADPLDEDALDDDAVTADEQSPEPDADVSDDEATLDSDVVIIADEATSGPDALTAVDADVDPPNFTHLDDQGAARMVDVSAKPATLRRATASCRVVLAPATLDAIRSGGVAKGDVLAVARVAGISAAKRTWELIPMCHQIPLSFVEVAFNDLDDGSGLSVTATAQAHAETGVEMEALTAASVAALTIYDMCKSAERGIRVTDLRLVSKTGGASGDYSAE